MAMNKQKLEQDVQKQQEKLVLRKKRRIIESTTQSPLPKLTENNPEKNNSLDNSEQPQYMHNNLEEVRLKRRRKVVQSPTQSASPNSPDFTSPSVRKITCSFIHTFLNLKTHFLSCS